VLEEGQKGRALEQASLPEDNSAAPILPLHSVSQATTLHVSKTQHWDYHLPPFS
jgi:hypothetical protein